MPPPFLADHGSDSARLSYRPAADVFQLAGGDKSRHASLAINSKPSFDDVTAATAAVDPDRLH